MTMRVAVLMLLLRQPGWAPTAAPEQRLFSPPSLGDSSVDQDPGVLRSLQ